MANRCNVTVTLCNVEFGRPSHPLVPSFCTAAKPEWLISCVTAAGGFVMPAVRVPLTARIPPPSPINLVLNKE